MIEPKTFICPNNCELTDIDTCESYARGQGCKYIQTCEKYKQEKEEHIREVENAEQCIRARKKAREQAS